MGAKIKHVGHTACRYFQGPGNRIESCSISCRLSPASARKNAFAVLARPPSWRARARDIINLGIGQPDFPTPPHIVEAAIKALRDGHHGYTPATGILPCREAVAEDLHRRFGATVSPER